MESKWLSSMSNSVRVRFRPRVSKRKWLRTSMARKASSCCGRVGSRPKTEMPKRAMRGRVSSLMQYCSQRGERMARPWPWVMSYTADSSCSMGWQLQACGLSQPTNPLMAQLEAHMRLARAS